MIEAAAVVNDLRVPRGNELKKLKRGRTGQQSIRINDQYRVCFVWTDNGAEDVEITDCHYHDPSVSKCWEFLVRWVSHISRGY